MGFVVNHKKVLRLTRKLGVLSFVRPTRKYNSYKGERGKNKVELRWIKSRKL